MPLFPPFLPWRNQKLYFILHYITTFLSSVSFACFENLKLKFETKCLIIYRKKTCFTENFSISTFFKRGKKGDSPAYLAPLPISVTLLRILPVTNGRMKKGFEYLLRIYGMKKEKSLKSYYILTLDIILVRKNWAIH
ncbi:hypothetical protein Mgra_00006232 [Meloidogyne graminicola]|uniref:Uncharacterized protein n=1 Tax=Meloidogyne graminicola TaxID=189291 RepID=A0A8S9ZLS2_9BILA|nr:hypothetical protein Mgra_00006232 [Meloidogyne graminicola]